MTPDHTFFCRIRTTLGARRVGQAFKNIVQKAQEKKIMRQIFTFVDATAVKAKETTWEQRDKALKDAGCDGIPVKTIHKGNEREGDITMELVKIDKKTFTKADFELPAGYSKSETATTPTNGGSEIKTQQEIMNMTPEERAKYIEEMKKKYGK